MDPGYRSALIDFFRRGEVAGDVRQMAAQGIFAPTPHDQVALLLLLSDDPDAAIAQTARATLDGLPVSSLARFIGRKDVPEPMRAFFVARGIQPVDGGETTDQPIGQQEDAAPEEASADPAVLANLPVIGRIKLAMRGSREQRSQLIRDSNKLVSVAVLTNPKVTESEVEGYARMANLSEDVLRVIATSRTWLKNYNIVAGLTRNPKTPTAIAMTFVQRLNEKDQKALCVDRNVPEAIRLAARKFVKK